VRLEPGNEGFWRAIADIVDIPDRLIECSLPAQPANFGLLADPLREQQVSEVSFEPALAEQS